MPASKGGGEGGICEFIQSAHSLSEILRRKKSLTFKAKYPKLSTRVISYSVSVSDEEGRQRIKICHFAFNNLDNRVLKERFERNSSLKKSSVCCLSITADKVLDLWWVLLDWRYMDKIERRLLALNSILNKNMKNKYLSKAKCEPDFRYPWFYVKGGQSWLSFVPSQTVHLHQMALILVWPVEQVDFPRGFILIAMCFRT